ncbi:MAG TPA: four helix bundle protein [Kofleriaceae bacterium]
MADTPPFGIRFTDPYRPLVVERAPTQDGVAHDDRVPVYRRAVELAARAHAVIERTETERFFLRDQLDRKSSLIPQLIAQGLAIAEMPARRALFRHARRALTDCIAILDMLVERGSAPLDAVDGTRTLARALSEELIALTVEPPRAW